MSTSIDNRVVQMEFDNAAFEKGVQESLNSLKSLHNTIEQLPHGDAINSVLDNISTGLASRVSQVKSGMGEIVSTITSGLGTIGKVAGGLSALSGGGIIGMALAGGKKRALNIEQAKFQLQGLEIAWADVSESINAAVDGTRYGLDSAAKAASQLAASNVQLGDDMTHALRAISGVASMTNSEYDDIANIFTRVAGQGKVMANDLNSIAARGLNAAAELAKAMGTTEAEVRDLVSKGKIDFMTFANAMNKAFGEQATKANETFTGAMANARAALSRIGAEFFVTSEMVIGEGEEAETVAVGGLEAMRRVFVAIIPVLNAIKMAMAPMVESFRLWSYNAAGAVEIVLERFRRLFQYTGKGGVKKLTDFGKGLGTIFQNLVHAIGSFLQPVLKVRDVIMDAFPFFGDIYDDMGAIYDFIRPIRLGVEKLTASMGLQQGAINLFAASLRFLLNVISPVAEGIASLVSATGTDLLDAYVNGKKTINNFLNGIANSLDSTKGTFEKYRDVVIGAFQSVAGTVQRHANRIRNFFLSIKNLVVEFASEKGIITWISDIPNKLVGALTKVISYGKPVLDFLSSLKDRIAGVVGEFAKGALSSLGGLFGGIDLFGGLSGSDDAEKAAPDMSKSMEDLEKSVDGSKFSKMLSEIGDSFAKFGSILDDGSAHLSDWRELFNGLKSAIGGFISEINPLEGAVEVLKNFFGAMKDFGTEKFQGLGSLAGDNAGVASMLDSISGAASSMFGKLKQGLPTAEQLRSVLDKLAGKLGQLLERIKPVAETLGSAFGSAIQNAGQFVSRFLGKIGELDISLDPVFNLLGSLAESLKNFFDGFQDGLPSFDGIAQFFSELVSALGGFGSEVASKLGEIGKGIGDLVSSFGGLDAIAGFASGLKGVLDGLNPTLLTTSDSIQKMSASVEKPVGMLSKSLNGISDSISQTSDTILSAEEVFGIADDGLGSKLQDLAGTVNSGVKSILPVALLAGVSFRFLQLSKSLQTFLEGTGKGIKKIGGFFESLQGVTDKLSGVAGKAQSKTEAFEKIALSVVALAAALFLLTTVPADKLWPAVGAIAVLGVILAGLTAGISLMTTKMKGLDTIQMQALGKALLEMSAAILILAVGVRLLSDLKIEQVGTALLGLLGAAGILVAASIALGQWAPGMLKAGLGLIAAAVGIVALTDAIRYLDGVDFMEYKRGLAAVVVGLVALTVMSHFLGAGGKGFIAFAAGLIIAAGAMIVFSEVIKYFNTIDWSSLGVGIGAFIGMIGVMAAFAVILSFAQKGMLAGAAGLLAMAAATVVVTGALIVLSKAMESMKNMEQAADMLLKFIVVLGIALTVMTAFSGNSNAAAVVGSILAMSVAIIVLTGALVILSALDTGKMAAAAIAIGALIAVIAIAAGLLSKNAAAVAAMTAFAGVLLSVSLVAIAAGVGFMIFVAALDLLGATAPAVAEGISIAMQLMADAFRQNGPESIAVLAALVVAAIGFGFALGLAGAGALAAAAGIAILILAVAAAFAIISNFVGEFDGSQFADIGGKMVSGIMDGILGGLAGAAEFLGNIGNTIGGFITGGFGQASEEVKASGEELAQSATEPLKKIPEETESSAKNASNAFTNIFGEGGTLGDSVSGGLGKVKDMFFGAMGDMTGITGDGAIDMTKAFSEKLGIQGVTEEQLSAMGVDVSNYAGILPDYMGTGAADASSAYAAELNMADVTSEEIDAVAAAADGKDLESVGKTKGQQLVTGMRSGLKGSRDVGSKGANDMVSGVRSVNVSEPGRAAGSGIVSGMIAGLNALAPSVYARASEIARTAALKAKSGAQVNSPSKLTIPVGEAIGEGLIVGMNNIEAQVNDSGKKLGRNAALAVQYAGSVMDNIDWDSEPVIRPVLDTSSIQAGMQTMDRLFAQESMLNAAGYAGRSYSSIGDSSMVSSNDTYYFSLDYRAGEDPNKLLMLIGNSIRQANLSKG